MDYKAQAEELWQRILTFDIAQKTSAVGPWPQWPPINIIEQFGRKCAAEAWKEAIDVVEMLQAEMRYREDILWDRKTIPDHRESLQYQKTAAYLKRAKVNAIEGKL